MTSRFVHLVRHGRALVAAAALFSIASGAAPAAELDVPVPSAVVYPGKDVLASGVTERGFRIKDEKLDLYVTDRQALAGLVARRTLIPGRPILKSHLKQPDIVKAGTEVILVYLEDGLMITGLGTALRSAGVGETVNVRNVDSGVTVAGTVADDGTVRVSG